MHKAYPYLFLLLFVGTYCLGDQGDRYYTRGQNLEGFSQSSVESAFKDHMDSPLHQFDVKGSHGPFVFHNSEDSTEVVIEGTITIRP